MQSREDRREAGGREARAAVTSTWGSQAAGPETARRGGTGDGGRAMFGDVREEGQKRQRPQFPQCVSENKWRPRGTLHGAEEEGAEPVLTLRTMSGLPVYVQW